MHNFRGTQEVVKNREIITNHRKHSDKGGSTSKLGNSENFITLQRYGCPETVGKVFPSMENSW